MHIHVSIAEVLINEDLQKSHNVDRGEVKDVRFGLFQGKPPVTRIVLDLKTPQSYQGLPLRADGYH